MQEAPNSFAFPKIIRLDGCRPTLVSGREYISLRRIKCHTSTTFSLDLNAILAHGCIIKFIEPIDTFFGRRFMFEVSDGRHIVISVESGDLREMAPVCHDQSEMVKYHEVSL